MSYTPCIVPTNRKGGVGKTTSSRVLAQTLAQMPEYHKGKPILICDLDPQCNAGRRWHLMEPTADGMSIPILNPNLDNERSSICDLWLTHIGAGEANLVPEPYDTANPMIKVVPAHEQLMEDVISIQRDKRPLLNEAMRKWLRSDVITDNYSYVIMDTAPTNTSLNEAALSAATHVYIPFVPEPQSVEGLLSIFSRILNMQSTRSTDDPLTLLGFLPNQVSKTRLHGKYLKMLRNDEDFGKYLMPVSLKRRIAYSETDNFYCDPDQVTAMEGEDIAVEAYKFARHIAQKVQQTMAAKEVNHG